MITRIVGIVLVAALGGGLAVGSAAAGLPTEQLRVQVDRVFKLLEDPQFRRERPQHRRVAVRKVADDIFDFSETARRSLGQHWQQRTPVEREEFVKLFADLLEHSYVSKIELFDGEKVGYAGDVVQGDQATVRTKIITRQGSEIPVNYRMHLRGDRWLVYDVEIEGVSLVSNYRSQFNKIIRTSSYDELVRKLKIRRGEVSSDARVQASGSR
jgi:phospholipid transport system substrate-binding protein